MARNPALSRRRWLHAAAGASWLAATGQAARAQMPTSGPAIGSGYAKLLPEVTGGRPARAERVHLEIPELADNGLSVPLRVWVDSPMSVDDHVRSITLLAEFNPRPVLLKAYLGPHSGRAQLVTRVRLAVSQRVMAVAQTSDGRYWTAQADVLVTESACLDAS